MGLISVGHHVSWCLEVLPTVVTWDHFLIKMAIVEMFKKHSVAFCCMWATRFYLTGICHPLVFFSDG